MTFPGQQLTDHTSASTLPCSRLWCTPATTGRDWPRCTVVLAMVGHAGHQTARACASALPMACRVELKSVSAANSELPPLPSSFHHIHQDMYLPCCFAPLAPVTIRLPPQSSLCPTRRASHRPERHHRSFPSFAFHCMYLNTRPHHNRISCLCSFDSEEV